MKYREPELPINNFIFFTGQCMILVWSPIARNHPGLSQYGGKWTISKAERTFSVHKCDEIFKILVAALVKMLAVLRDFVARRPQGPNIAPIFPTQSSTQGLVSPPSLYFPQQSAWAAEGLNVCSRGGISVELFMTIEGKSTESSKFRENYR